MLKYIFVVSFQDTLDFKTFSWNVSFQQKSESL